MPAPVLLLRGATLLALATALNGCSHIGAASGSDSTAAHRGVAADSKQRILNWWNDAQRLAEATRETFDNVQQAAKRGDIAGIDGTLASSQQAVDAARYRVTTYVPDGLNDASNDLFTAFSEYETALNLVAESQNGDAQAALSSARAHASAGEHALRTASRETLVQYERAGGRKADIATI